MSVNPVSMPRLAILPDFREEGWPSMDLCAEQFLKEAKRRSDWSVEECLPSYVQPFRFLGRRGHNLNRAWNRYVRYPRYTKSLLNRFDFFHIVDHSYAHLVNELPAGRTGVYCHDLDAFQSVLKPPASRASVGLRWLMRRVLTGLQKACLIFVNSEQTAAQLLEQGLIPAERIVRAPLGIAEEFRPADTPPEPFTLLHVGSCIPRKRIDVLLRVVALVRQQLPQVRLLKVGGEWTAEHQRIIADHHLQNAIVHRHNLSRAELAKAYQNVAVVLVTSEAEGFGLTAVEALACGAIVLASDIPPLREGGGSAACLAPVGDVAAWSAQLLTLLNHPELAPARNLRLAQASRFSWTRYSETILSAYSQLWQVKPTQAGR